MIRPQLAKSVDSIEKACAKGEWYIEHKLDGHRMIVDTRPTPAIGYSRQGKIMDAQSIAHIVADLPRGYVFDGELVPKAGRATSTEVTHLRSEAPESLEYVVFDLLEIEGWQGSLMSASQRMRKAMLDKLHIVGNARKSEYVTLKGGAGFKAEFEAYLKTLPDGSEGVMLKKAEAKYTENSRSAWLKWKFVETVDVVITDCLSKPTEWRVRPGEVGTDGVLYPEGRHSDPWLAGHVGLSYGYYCPKRDVFVRVGSLGWTGRAEDLTKYVGRVVEVKTYGIFEGGALRHPVVLRVRETWDKDAKECLVPVANIEKV